MESLYNKFYLKVIMFTGRRFLDRKEEKMRDFLSRKFIGFILISGMLFVLVLLDRITGAEFVSFTTLNLGIYSSSNVAEAIGLKK